MTRKEGVAVFAVKTANHCSRPPLLQLLGTTHIPRCLPLSLSGSGPWGCKSVLLLRCSPVRSARVAAREAPTLLCSHGTCPSAVCCHTLISSRASVGLAQRHVSKRIFLTELMHVIVQKFGLALAPRRVRIGARGGVGKLYLKNFTRSFIMYLSLDSGVITKNLHHCTAEAESPVCGHRTVLCNEQRLCVRACACVRARMSHLLQLTSI